MFVKQARAEATMDARWLGVWSAFGESPIALTADLIAPYKPIYCKACLRTAIRCMYTGTGTSIKTYVGNPAKFLCWHYYLHNKTKIVL